MATASFFAAWVPRHKFVLVLIFGAAIIGLYWAYTVFTAGSAPTRYITAAVTRGTIIASVSGSGQVAATNEVDIVPKVSGTVTEVDVQGGDSVGQGQLLARIDPTTAARALRNAQNNLSNTQIALAKLTAPADQLTLTQNQDAVAQAEQAEQDAQISLTKDYSDAYTAIANAFADIPNVVSGANATLFSYSNSLNQQNIDYYYNLVKDIDPSSLSYRTSAQNDYNTAYNGYNQNFLDYNTTLRTSSTSTIQSLLDETYATAIALAQSLHSNSNLLSFVKNTLTTYQKPVPALIATQLTNTTGYTTTLDSDLQALVAIEKTITNDKNTIAYNAEVITEKKLALQKLQGGADPLDVQSAQLAVEQQKNAVADAEDTLANYYIRAPFNGTVGKITVKTGNAANAGSALAMLITKDQLAQLTLNEVDAAKVKVGQKATLTFDALSDLTIAGKVAEIDTLGTVSQGVVSYGVQIAFATQDPRVKPGMSVNASIITDERPGALSVPSSAIKTQNGHPYVLIFDAPLPATPGAQGAPSATLPRQVPVTIGIASNSTTEIVSGLIEGQSVVVRTVSSGSPTAQSQAPSLLSSGGGRSLLGGGGRNGGGR